MPSALTGLERLGGQCVADYRALYDDALRFTRVDHFLYDARIHDAFLTAGTVLAAVPESPHVMLSGLTIVQNPGVVQELLRTITSAQTIADTDQRREWNASRPISTPAAACHARSRPSRSTASRSDNPSNDCNTITVANTRAGTVGRPNRDRMYKSAK